MKKIGLAILMKAVEGVLAMVDEETAKDTADKILDVVEDAVKKSENKIDDALVIPACRRIRDWFDIPDND